MEGYVVAIAAAITVIGTIYGARSSRKSSDLARKIETNKAEASAKAEVLKTEVLTKAETIKVATETETKRIDQVIESQQKFIQLLQEENKQQRSEMLEKDKLHREEMLAIRKDVAENTRLMSICIEERSKFKYEMEKQTGLYNALETQFKGSKAFQRAKEFQQNTDVTIKGEMTGEVQ